MTIAVLPFNAGPGAKPALARQFANFAVDIVREATGVDINAVSYLVKLEGEPPTFANINPSESLNEPEMLAQFFEQSKMDKTMDGLLEEEPGEKFSLTFRIFNEGVQEPASVETLASAKDQVFSLLRPLVVALSREAGGKISEEMSDDVELFGTENQPAFLAFLEGYDALQYVERSQGQVAAEFSPEPAMDLLLSAIEADQDWEAPYITLIQLCRAAVQMRMGSGETVERVLQKAIEMVPSDGRGLFALGELYEAIGSPAKASETFEKAHELDPAEPAILARLGMAQMTMGMPVNAERNFRRALELEGADKPSTDFLAQVLVATNRAHEVPALWKSLVEANPENGLAHARYAMALMQAGQEEESIRAFDVGLESVAINSVVKRFYAPVLAQKGEMDRAMDLYEDCLDESPTDIPLLLEYAQTLQNSGRQFEVPKILQDVLAANPDTNTRAQTLAWKIELEQPKRIEAVQSASQKIESEDFQGAVRELRPLKNWLADYWKMWLLLSTALNRIGESQEAEDAARRLLNLFPGCEPAYGELVAALGAQGRNDEAYNVMRYAANTIQGSLPIAINLALAAKRVGRDDEARALAKQIREAVGQNIEIEPVLAEIER